MQERKPVDTTQRACSSDDSDDEVCSCLPSCSSSSASAGSSTTSTAFRTVGCWSHHICEASDGGHSLLERPLTVYPLLSSCHVNGREHSDNSGLAAHFLSTLFGKSAPHILTKTFDTSMDRN